VYNGSDGWGNATAGPTVNSDSNGFWLNDGNIAIFPSGFERMYGGGVGRWQRSNFNNALDFTPNTIKSSSSNILWVLQSVSGNTYTFKRADAVGTMILNIRLNDNGFTISGDSGSGQENWNGTWSWHGQ
jgi:hypothetical protein